MGRFGELYGLVELLLLLSAVIFARVGIVRHFWVVRSAVEKNSQWEIKIGSTSSFQVVVQATGVVCLS
jgi:hypothetical protein